MHQEAFDEVAHLVLRIPPLSIFGAAPFGGIGKKLPRLSGAVLLGRRGRTRPGSAPLSRSKAEAVARSILRRLKEAQEARTA
jgi:hypothetical protein